MKSNVLFLLLSLLLFSACRKDIDEIRVDRDEDPPAVFIKNTIRGKVVDEAGAPISNAAIQVENQMIQSDADGCFLFNKITVKKDGTIVTAKSDDYFDGISHSNFAADGSSFVEIRMMKKGLPQFLSSADGGSVSNNDLLTINIPPDALVNENGNLYDGPVKIYSRWLDPTDDNIGATMPGALIASDENGNRLALASFGMAVFELEADNGARLEIKDGAEIELEIPIPQDLLAEAPDEIDLWLFDLEEEEWLLKGTCNKTGNNYKCLVQQTGFWNCDVALPAICLSGQVFNSDSTFAAYLKVTVEDLTDNFIYWGYTDSTGFFCGSVPQAAPLRISIEDHCDNVVYTADIGPFSTDFQLDDIYLTDVVETYLVNISGDVFHCITDDLFDGHLAVRYPGNLRIYPFIQSNFDFDFALKCIDFPELNIVAYSLSDTAASATFVYNDPSNIQINTQTCESLSDYFYMSVNGTEHWAAPTQFYLKNNVTTNWMVLEGLSGGGKFILDLRDYQGVGTYNQNAFFKMKNYGPFPQYPNLTTSSPDFSVQITIDDGVFIEGTLTGLAIDSNGNQQNIFGEFKIRKSP